MASRDEAGCLLIVLTSLEPAWSQPVGQEGSDLYLCYVSCLSVIMGYSYLSATTQPPPSHGQQNIILASLALPGAGV